MKLQVTTLALAVTASAMTWPGLAQSEEIWTKKTSQGAKTTSDAHMETAAQLQQLNTTFTSLAQELSPSVVNIFSTSRSMPRGGRFEDGAESSFGHPFESSPGFTPREAKAMGTGFVINKDGLIVTNAHVVRSFGKNADEIMVKFIGEENSKGHVASVVGVDEVTDVALLKLKVPKADLKVAPLGDSDSSKVGEMVIAIGNPYGHSHSVTQGVLSAKGRSIEGIQSDFLQTSASINPGNSGGPLINISGEVIGINTAIDPRGQGLGFAIPINTAKNVISQLATKGEVERPWLGLAIQDLSEEVTSQMSIDDQTGVLVGEVMPNSPAAAAGIKTYDVIKAFNGKKVSDTKQLLTELQKAEIGKPAAIGILRNQRQHSLNIKIAKRPRA